MPTYEYRCKECGDQFDIVQSFSDDALTTCQACGGPLRKVFGNVGIAFKGSGFYKNDSRPESKKSTSAKGEGSTSGRDNGSGSGSSDSGSSGSGSSDSGSSDSGTGSSGSSGSGSSSSSDSGSSSSTSTSTGDKAKAAS